VLAQEQRQLSGLNAMALLLVERVALRAGQRVLALGCGTGALARLAASHLGPTGTVVGREWRQEDAAQLPFAMATFDVIVCQQGLQSFADQPAALREMCRVLVTRGTAALTVLGAPDRYSAVLAETLAKHVGTNMAKLSLEPFVLSDVDALRAMVRAAGFGEPEIRTSVVMRRVEPSQEWLLQEIAGSPCARAIAALDAATRAAMVRDISAALRDLWNFDSFAVPAEVHLVKTRK
jgi:SAM-dependent methyltransferase